MTLDPIRQDPMCLNHNNKFYVVVICPTNQSMFYKLVHPKDTIKQPNLSTAERMKLKKLTQAVPSSPGRRVGLLVGSQARSARHRLAAGAACRWGRPAPVPPSRHRTRPPLGPPGSAATDCSTALLCPAPRPARGPAPPSPCSLTPRSAP